MREPHHLVLCHLRATQVPFTVFDHEELVSFKEINTPADFAEQIGYDVERILKTLVLKGKGRIHSFVAVVSPVTERMDFSKLANLLGHRLEVASPIELEAITHYPKLGVSPFGLPSFIPVVVSDSVTTSPSVVVGGGKVGLEIDVAPQDLIAAVLGVVADVRR